VAELVVVGIDDAYDAHRILAEMTCMDAGPAREPEPEDPVAGLLITSPMQSTFGPGARGDDLSGSLSDCGVEEGFVLSLAEMLQDAAAALFLVVRKSQTGKVLEELSGFPGRVLRSSLAVDQIPRLRRALSDACTAPRYALG
jgi:uncharacterized membrane protein